MGENYRINIFVDWQECESGNGGDPWVEVVRVDEEGNQDVLRYGICSHYDWIAKTLKQVGVEAHIYELNADSTKNEIPQEDW